MHLQCSLAAPCGAKGERERGERGERKREIQRETDRDRRNETETETEQKKQTRKARRGRLATRLEKLYNLNALPVPC